MVSLPPRSLGPTTPLRTLAGDVKVPRRADPRACGGQDWEQAVAGVAVKDAR